MLGVQTIGYKVLYAYVSRVTKGHLPIHIHALHILRLFIVHDLCKGQRAAQREESHMAKIPREQGKHRVDQERTEENLIKVCRRGGLQTKASEGCSRVGRNWGFMTAYGWGAHLLLQLHHQLLLLNSGTLVAGPPKKKFPLFDQFSCIKKFIK